MKNREGAFALNRESSYLSYAKRQGTDTIDTLQLKVRDMIESCLAFVSDAGFQCIA
jgi:hypothetical protein